MSGCFLCFVVLWDKRGTNCIEYFPQPCVWNKVLKKGISFQRGFVYRGSVCVHMLYCSSLKLAWSLLIGLKFVQGICNNSFIFGLKRWVLSRMCSIVTCKHAFTCPCACFLLIFSKTKLVASSPRDYWQTLILIFTINLQAQWTQLQSWSQMLISQNPWSKAIKLNECPLRFVFVLFSFCCMEPYCCH